ncbi:hypothetical protein CRG98_018415 [Punica granatum]|uniref:Uncharacterized protein n=1 Tax=Punica granatum TaxID=22663 RepID=A0A2I0JXX4_PUNGR|nr:hypothetical protein CRG98_018415 [Punica granatum]
MLNITLQAPFHEIHPSKVGVLQGKCSSIGIYVIYMLHALYRSCGDGASPASAPGLAIVNMVRGLWLGRPGVWSELMNGDRKHRHRQGGIVYSRTSLARLPPCPGGVLGTELEGSKPCLHQHGALLWSRGRETKESLAALIEEEKKLRDMTDSVVSRFTTFIGFAIAFNLKGNLQDLSSKCQEGTADIVIDRVESSTQGHPWQDSYLTRVVFLERSWKDGASLASAPGLVIVNMTTNGIIYNVLDSKKKTWLIQRYRWRRFQLLWSRGRETKESLAALIEEE